MLHLAWRNLWRNRRRTIITLTALAIGVAGLVLLHSYRVAAYEEIIRNLTTQMVGHMQVHGRGYQESPTIDVVVDEPVTIEARIAKALPGVHAERRVLGAGLGGTGERSSGVMITGIQPDNASGIAAVTIRAGRALAPVAAREAVLGVDLAAQLHLAPGGEIIIVGAAKDGSVANDRYTVVGTGDAGTSELNSTAVFLHLEDAQDFFGLGDAVHVIVLHLPDDTNDDDLALAANATRGALDLQTLEALTWNEMLPEFKNTIAQKQKSQRVLDWIVFFLVGLGVLNAMTMATFERTREFGVMLALGTRPWRIVVGVVVEALLQGALGLLAGVAIVVVVLFFFGRVSLPGLSDSDIMGIRMPGVLTITPAWGSIGEIAITVFCTMLVGGIVPALRAARLRPIDAMRSTS